MNQKTSKIDYEIDLLELFKVIWREKVKIILIVLFSFGIGVYYVVKNTQPPSYDISLDFYKGKNSDFIKFSTIRNLIHEYPDVSSDIYTFNNDNNGYEGNLFNKFGKFNLLDTELILDRFVLELMDFDELTEVLKNNTLIKKELSQLLSDKKQIKMYSYAKLFTIEKPSKSKTNYTVNFKWNDKNEIIQILSDVFKITLINLENSIYKELEDTLKAKKEIKKNNDLKRIDYLLEQSAIAKEIDIKDNQISSIDMPDSNVMFNISTINANMPYYLRGYNAIDKEINLIKNRKYQDLDNLYSEINELKQQNTNWINYNIYLAEIKTIKNQNKIKIVSLFIMLGIIIGVLYVIILNALQSSKVVRK
jgi:hypothetical protein